MSARPRAQNGAAEPKAPARPKSRPRRRKASAKAVRPPGGVWHWQTPNEAWKTRWALKLIALTLLLVALWGGEVQLTADEWKVGLRNVQGRPFVGLTWARNHSPRFWRAR